MSTKDGVTMALIAAALSSTLSGSAGSSLSYPSLCVVERALLTTAKDDFDGHAKAFEAAAKWNGERLRASSSNSSYQDDMRGPHLACAGYGHGSEIFSRLQELLSPEGVRLVSHSGQDGACFIATASHAQVAAIAAEPDQLGLESFAPFPSAMKLAPGLLEHRQSSRSGRLNASHGTSMRMSNVVGLSVELSPGTLPAHSSEADSFIVNLLGDLMSESLDLHGTNFWSDPAMFEGGHVATPGGAVRRHDWSMAATAVHELSKAGRTSPGDICSWNGVAVNQVATDVLLISGMYCCHVLQCFRPTLVFNAIVYLSIFAVGFDALTMQEFEFTPSAPMAGDHFL